MLIIVGSDSVMSTQFDDVEVIVGCWLFTDDPSDERMDLVGEHVLEVSVGYKYLLPLGSSEFATSRVISTFNLLTWENKKNNT